MTFQSFCSRKSDLLKAFQMAKFLVQTRDCNATWFTIFWHFLSLPNQTRHFVFLQLFISQHFVFNCVNRITLHEYVFITKRGWIAHYANLSYLVFDAFADEFKVKALNLNSCKLSIANIKFESILWKYLLARTRRNVFWGSFFEEGGKMFGFFEHWKLPTVWWSL